MNKPELLKFMKDLLQKDLVWPEEFSKEDIALLDEMADDQEELGRIRIFQAITSPDTGYCRPEYDSWTDLLGTSFDRDMLDRYYPEYVLEQLWTASHIVETMTRQEINTAMAAEINSLKIMDIMMSRSRNRELPCVAQEMSRARLTGLYNLLYED